jgi:hypothetical protein
VDRGAPAGATLGATPANAPAGATLGVTPASDAVG